MPSFYADLFDKDGAENASRSMELYAKRESEAVEELREYLTAAWLPGPRRERGSRPLIGRVMRLARGESVEVARLRWTLDGVIDMVLPKTP